MSDAAEPGASFGIARQLQIYGPGLQGHLPALPIALEALEEQARAALDPRAYDYVAGGAGVEDTMRANLAAFRRWRIVPRMLRDVERCTLRRTVLGLDLPAPVLLAPVGVQGLVHPEGELAVARAAAALGLPMVLRVTSSYAMEEVAQSMGAAPRWFQLYWSRHPGLTASLVTRAERAGYSAIVVTLDTALLGWRERDLQRAYQPFLLGQGLTNYFSDPVVCGEVAEPPAQNPTAAVQLWLRIFGQPALTWDDLSFLRQHTGLPVLLKGILHPHDAARAVDLGLDGIVVSNPGGRQVDGAIAALEALPGVVAAVDGRIPVLFDGGIRRGADVFKALALGAQAVLLGRPYLWGLALGGEQGVRAVLQNLLADLDLTVALSGYAGLDEVDASALVLE